MTKRITLADIAKELNMTPATVSRALSDHPEINTNTKKIVNAAAKRLDYNPNKIASSLRSGKTRVIGVIIPTAKHIFFGSVINGITNMASSNGYDVLIYQSNETQILEKKGINTFINARVDGILISIAKGTTDFEHFVNVRKKNIPIAFFDRVNDNLGIPCVAIDDYRGAYMVTEALIKKGYKRIAHISGPAHIKTFADRIRGYQDAMTAHYLTQESDWIYNGDISIDAGRTGVKYFLDHENKPDAIFAVEDFTALGVLKELKERQIKVPSDMGVFGFSNDLFGEHITPSLSSVDQQTVLMGEEAFKLLKIMIDNENERTVMRKLILDPVLIERESSDKS